MLRPGSLLISHPTRSHPFDEEAVILVTELNNKAVTGLRINLVDDRAFEDIVRPEFISYFPIKKIFLGGPHNPGALTMFHSGTWYSKNTMTITSDWSISSDELMLEKIGMNNTPDYFKLCLGWTNFNIRQLQQKNSPWLIHENPSYELMTAHHTKQWQIAIQEISKISVQTYFPQ